MLACLSFQHVLAISKISTDPQNYIKIELDTKMEEEQISKPNISWYLHHFDNQFQYKGLFKIVYFQLGVSSRPPVTSIPGAGIPAEYFGLYR